MIKFALPALAALSLAACADSTPEDAVATDTATDTTMTEPMAADTGMAADPAATGTAMATDPMASETGTMTDDTTATPAPTATSTPM